MIMQTRSYNFYSGPAALPLDVLKKAQEDLIDYKGIGMSLMEISPRSKEYEELHNETQLLFKELLQLPDSYKVLSCKVAGALNFQ